MPAYNHTREDSALTPCAICAKEDSAIDTIKNGTLVERDGDLWLKLASETFVQLTKTGDWYGVLDDTDEEVPEDGEPRVYPIVEVYEGRESIRCVAESEDEAFRIIKRCFRFDANKVSYRISEVPFARDPG